MIYRLELLIIGIILVVVSYIPVVPYPLDQVLFWVGVVLIIIWFILLIVLLVAHR